MKLIVGLGNPGSKYEYTRHNIGFRVIDEIATRADIKVKKIKFKGLYEKTRAFGEEIILLKPHTYMNESGISVREAADYFGIETKDIIIVYDDIDIDFGTIRVKPKGSSGSHNGMKSVIYHLKDDSFPRVRVSIGSKPEHFDLADYVLSTFSKDEEKTVEKEVDYAADAVIEMIKNGTDSAMNKFNGRSLI